MCVCVSAISLIISKLNRMKLKPCLKFTIRFHFYHYS